MNLSSIVKKIKEKGVYGSARMLSVRFKKMETFVSIPTKKICYNIEGILSASYKRIIIFENHFGYNNIMLQRPQHMLRNMADSDTLILYNSYYDVDFCDNNHITKIIDHCYILDLFYYRKLVLDFVKKSKSTTYVLIYSTDTVPIKLVNNYIKNGIHVIYEYVDDINPALISEKKLSLVLQRHQMLVENPNTIVVATASKLYMDVKKINAKKEPIFICNGVETKLFQPNATVNDKSYLEWLDDEKIKVGYYGALASWVDYELLRKISDDNNIQIILIGIEHDQSLRESRILEKENIKFIGKKPYNLLAGYANCFDICIIPFQINSITEATSPVKLFEYMSLGKPIVTTALPECKKYDVVMVAENHDDFLQKLYQAYEKRTDIGQAEKLQRCAKQHDWKEKASALKQVLFKEESR